MDTPGYKVPKTAIARKRPQGFRLVKESASKMKIHEGALAERFPKTKQAATLTEKLFNWKPTREHQVAFNQDAKRSGPLQWSRQYIERRGKTGAVYTEKNILRFTSIAAPGQIDSWPRDLQAMATRHHDKGAFDNSLRWDQTNVGSYLQTECASSGQTPGPKFLHPGVSQVQPHISHFGKQHGPRVLFSHKKTMGAVHSTGGHSPGPCALYNPLRSLNVTQHMAMKSSFGSGFTHSDKKVRMKKIPLGQSLKDAFRTVPKSPGLPVRTNEELERTGRQIFIGKLVEDNNEIPKFKKQEKPANDSDSDSDGEDAAEAKAARDQAMLEAQRQKLRELMS